MFAARTVLAGANVTIGGHNFSAGNEPGEDTGSGAIRWFDSVWYQWTAPTNGSLHLGITGGNNSFIPSVRVYRGMAVDTLSLASVLGDGSVPVVAGDMVHIQVASIYYPVWGGGGGSGAFTLSLSLETPQATSANNLFVNRLAIGPHQFHFNGSLYGASSEVDEPLVSGTATQTLWFTFTPPQAGLLVVSADSAQFNVNARMFQGSTLNSLTPVASLDGSPPAFNLASNREYVLQLSSEWTPVGRVSLVTDFRSLANDFFTNSYHLLGTNVSTVGDNRNATLESGEILPMAGSAGRTLWYSWEAPASGRVRISSGSCCMNRALAVYQGSGSGLGTLQRILSGQDSLIFMAQAGSVYHIQVDGVAGNAAEFTLAVTLTPAQPALNDNFEQATGLIGTQAESTSWINWATLQSGEPLHRGNAPTKSLWWAWQAPLNGDATIGAFGSLATNLTVAVYTGDQVQALTLVAKRTNNSVSFPVIGGNTYRIAGVADPLIEGDVIMRASVFGAFNGTPSISVPGNLLLEPSFEGTGLSLAHWQLSTPNFGGGYVGERGGADGNTWIVLDHGVSMWQDFATITGKSYRIKFAFRPEFGASTSRVKVWWDNREIGLGETIGGHWNWTNLTVTASNSVSRLKVEVVFGRLGFDGFSVVPADAAPVIVTHPKSVSTFSGGSATFLVGVTGSAPLSYLWHGPGGLITNQNSQSLTLDDVVQTDAGGYFVIVSNSFGAVKSSVANLVVELATSPIIVLQPYGQSVPLGGYASVSAAAVGTLPLQYQWFLNGDLLPGATNRQVVLPSFDLTNAGTYAVRVSNNAQTVWSLPAILSADTNAVGGGALWFANEIPDGGFTRKAPVFDADGITKLNGSAFVAQLYAGPDLPSLRPVSGPRVFRTGFSAGLISPMAVELPNVSPLTTAFVQVRVWQSNKGESYEEARALGGKFGKSEVLQITPGIMPSPPPLWGLQSFSLQAGLPEFVAGRIDFVGKQEDGTLSWLLTGNAGYRYVIEKSTGNSIWSPYLVLTNITGGVTFADTGTNVGVSFFRARILE